MSRAQPVRIGSVQDGQWFVTEGLKAGDKVVVEGFQKFVAGDKVMPHAWHSRGVAMPAPRRQASTAQAQR